LAKVLTLSSVNFSHNKLTEFPSVICTARMRKVDLSHNGINRVRTTWSRMTTAWS
jgi:Leucine-rich repeat (LRR) protein